MARGPAPTLLTEEQTIQVEALAAYLTQEQIADYLGITRRTFLTIKNRQPEVEAAWARGRSKCIGGVAKGLVKQAMEGNTTAAIFYLKTQAGWKEAKDPDTVINITPKTLDDFYSDGTDSEIESDA